MSELTDKQKRFCEEYVIDLNATQAAIRAGYSEKTAAVIGAENLTKPNIQSFIQEKQKKLSEDTSITAQMVINEIAKIAFSNIQDYIGGGNEVEDISLLTPNKAAAVSMIKKEETHFEGGHKVTVSFKLYDKISALEKLGRHLGIFEKDNEQSRLVMSPAINVKAKRG